MPSPSAIGMAPIPNNRGTGLKVRVLLSIGRRHTGVRPSFLVFLRFKVSGVSLARKESTSEAAIKRRKEETNPNKESYLVAHVPTQSKGSVVQWVVLKASRVRKGS